VQTSAVGAAAAELATAEALRCGDNVRNDVTRRMLQRIRHTLEQATD
jgi:hypothetical protein